MCPIAELRYGSVVTVLLALLLSATAGAQTLHVPGDHSTIQGAINAASDGFEIIVAPGTYDEGLIDLSGKAVHLRSSHGPAVTTINGSGLGQSVFIIWFGEGADTIIEGFTITGGTGTFGGGMRIQGSSPTVTNCVFMSNSAGDGFGTGGGMRIQNGSPTITGCIFKNNNAQAGGGLWISGGNPAISNTVIEDNSASNHGGGLFMEFSSPEINNAEFIANTAGGGGGAVRVTSNSFPVFSNTDFIGNTSTGGGNFDGGGGINNSQGSAPTITGCTFVGNTATAADGGGILNQSTGNPPSISNTLFCENSPSHITGAWNNFGGNEFLANCPTPPVGACCFLNEPCNPELTSEACDEIGGTWLGAGAPCAACTSCDGNCGGVAPGGCWCDNACFGFDDCCDDVCEYCPGQVTGCHSACCNKFSGECTVIPGPDCVGADFIFHGPGTSCSPNPCPTVACCLPDGACEDMFFFDCSDAGGFSQGQPGDGTFCLSDSCNSCEGYCGGTAPGGCSCAPDCFNAGNCCDDVCEQCPSLDGCFGACCNPFGDCFVTTEDDCGFTWHGPGTTCSPNPCPEPTGACCFPDGSCGDGFTSSQCANAGGNWHILNICAFVNCPVTTGACCNTALGTCEVTTQDGCFGEFAVWQGEGTTCSPNPCPTGGCCFPDGSCDDMFTNLECSNAGGSWQGLGFTCTIVDCPSTTGACCFLTTGTCSELTQQDCLAQDDTVFQGVDSTCSPDPCEPFGACCFDNGVCSEMFTSACADAGGVFQGDLTACPPDGPFCPNATCEGHCGGQAVGGCWCDAECFARGDCCDDICLDCPEVGECAMAKVVGIEIIQSVQDWNNSIPLIRGKETWVRVHFEPFRDDIDEVLVGAKLTVNNLDGPDSTITLDPVNDPSSGVPAGFIVAQHGAADPDVRRDMTNSLNFRIPTHLHAHPPVVWPTGLMEFTLEPVDAGFDCSSSSVMGESCTLVRAFQWVARPEIKLFGAAYTDGDGTQWAAVGQDDLINLSRRLRAMLPTSGFDVEFGTVTFNEIFAPPAGEWIIARMLLAKTLELSPGPRIYMAVLDVGSDDVRPRGMAGWCFGGFTAYSLFNPADIHEAIYSTPAHEIAHNLGLGHAYEDIATCGSECQVYCSDEVENPASFLCLEEFDYETDGNVALLGPIGDPDTEIWGLDTHVATPNNLPFVISPYRSFALMSACGGVNGEPRWTTALDYEFLLDRIQQVYGDAAAIQGGAGGEYIVVAGEINLATGSVVFESVVSLEFAQQPPLPPDGAYVLQALDEEKFVLDEISFEPLVPVTHETSDIGLFVLTMPADPSIRELRVVLGDDVLGQTSASNNPPTVEIISPAGGEVLEGQTAVIQWDASDPDDDELSFSVQFSADDGVSWTMLAIDWPDQTLVVNPQQLTGTAQGRVRVIASDGFYSAVAESEQFSVADTPPIVAINAPQNGADVFYGQSIVFEAFAFDVEDGVLEGNAIVWNSNLDGTLGTGTELILPATELAQGSHVITATAHDSADNTATAAVQINVHVEFVPCPSDISGPDGTPDGTVDVFDLIELINQWGPCTDPSNCPADFSGAAGEPDGVVDVFDLIELINSWGPCP